MTSEPSARTASGDVVRWRAVLALLVGTFTGTLLNNIVNVPLRPMVRGLHVPVTEGALVVTSFNLSFAILMPLTGWLGDRLGRRRLFCWAVVTVAAAALGAMAAPSLALLVVCRVVQGAGTAAVLPTVMGLLNDLHSRDQVGLVLGMWAAMNGLGRAVAAPLGGAITSAVSWRWVFVPAVPLAGLALVGALLFVPANRGSDHPLEWRGALSLTAGCGLIITAATAVPESGLASAPVIVPALCGVLLLAVFVRGIRCRRTPFIDPALLAEPSYVRSSLAAFAQMFCLSAALLAVPLYLTRAAGSTVSSAGLILFALPGTMVLLGPVTGSVVRRLGARRILRVGMAVLIAAQVTLVLVLGVAGGALTQLIPALVLDGVGAALVQTPAAVGATRSAAGRVGSGLGLFNLLRFAGAAFGAAWVAIALGAGHGGDTAVFAVCGGLAALGLAATWVGRSAPGRLDVAPAPGAVDSGA